MGYISNELFANNNPIFLHESSEDNPSNTISMSDPDGDREHDSDPDSPSHDHITLNASRHKAIPLNLSTNTYNTAQTPITTIVNTPTHSTKRLREISITYDTPTNYKENYCLLYKQRHSYPRNFLDMNKTEDASLLIHGKDGLPEMYITNYPTHIPPIAAFREYHKLAKTDGIDDIILFTKADGYTVEIAQPTTTINKLKMRRENYLYTTEGPRWLEKKMIRLG